MNSKAIKRQLLAAIAMVLVAAIALGSSTYAWFVQAGSVTAEGMQVNLTSEGGLVIRYVGAGDAWGVTATANMAGPQNLLPTSTKDMTQWTYAKAASSTKYNMDETSYKVVTDDVIGNTGFKENNYVVMKEFQIRSSNPSIAAKGLTVKTVTVTKTDDKDATQDLSNSLKVGLRWNYAPETGNEKSGYLIMSPLSIGEGQGTTRYTFVAPGDAIDDTGFVKPGTAETVTMKTAGTDATLLDNTVAVSSDTDHPVNVQVYIWYEGQDSHLYSDNVNAAEGLKVSLEFTSEFADKTVGA